MFTATVLKAVNQQIQHEQISAHNYLAVSIYFAGLSLHGLESFMAQQAQDERIHADKFIRHVMDRGGQVSIGALPAPASRFASPLEATKSVRDQEHATTEQIHRLYALARKERDFALEVLLHWFITEQVEEEKWTDELTALMTTFAGHPGQLFMLDHQWAKRLSQG